MNKILKLLPIFFILVTIKMSSCLTWTPFVYKGVIYKIFIKKIKLECEGNS